MSILIGHSIHSDWSVSILIGHSIYSDWSQCLFWLVTVSILTYQNIYSTGLVPTQFQVLKYFE